MSCRRRGVDIITEFPTDRLNMQRLLRSRQIDNSNDSCQSLGAEQLATSPPAESDSRTKKCGQPLPQQDLIPVTTS